MKKRIIVIPTIVLVIGALILFVLQPLLIQLGQGGLGLLMVIFGVPMVIAGIILMFLAIVGGRYVQRKNQSILLKTAR